MTWTAAIMPDDALPPDSLVGRMLRPSADDVTWDTPKEFRAKGARVSGANGEPIAEFVFDECTMKDGETYRLSYDEQTGTVRPDLIADAMQFMDEYDSDLQAMADTEKAEREATVEPMPLWRVMVDAYNNSPSVSLEGAMAAEIEALRDHVLPTRPKPDESNRVAYYIWLHEQTLRAQLTEQARLARGER